MSRRCRGLSSVTVLTNTDAHLGFTIADITTQPGLPPETCPTNPLSAFPSDARPPKYQYDHAHSLTPDSAHLSPMSLLQTRRVIQHRAIQSLTSDKPCTTLLGLPPHPVFISHVVEQKPRPCHLPPFHTSLSHPQTGKTFPISSHHISSPSLTQSPNPMPSTSTKVPNPITPQITHTHQPEWSESSASR